MTAPRTSIQRKLVTAMMLTSTTALVLTGVALFFYDNASFRQALARSMVTRAEILAATSTAALAFENRDDATQVLAALRSDPSIVMAALYDRHGRLFATYPAEAPASVPFLSPGEQGARFERSAIVVLEPVVEGARVLGTLYLESDLRVLTGRIRVFTLALVLAVMGSIAVAFALSSWLQRGIAQPIRLLTDAAQRVSETKDFAIRAHAVSDDELGLLTGSFNEMLNEIQQRDAALRASEAQLRQLNGDLERRVRARTDELEVSNRELEAFSYSVSHDLRAPVRHIDGFADMLGRHAGATLDEKGRRYLATITESAKNMGALIDDLLSFSRMGRAELQHSTVDLDRIVSELRREVEAETSSRSIEWRLEPLPELRGDPAMLRQVMANLILNAVKYTQPRPSAIIEIGSRTSDEETIVFVRDNGVGFDPTYSHKLFGVFQRLHSAEEFEGTGIGLANVRRIIQRHGGRTWAEGEVDRGATFYFSLPRQVAVDGTPWKEVA